MNTKKHDALEGKTMVNYDELIRQDDKCREIYRDGISAYISRLNKESYDKREAFMPPETYYSRIEEYRAKYREMLGLDQFAEETVPAPVLTRVAEKDDADIYRLTLHITAEIPMFGLLFVPKGVGKMPLVIAQHGNGGTPELCSDLHGYNRYNHMVGRALSRGAAVFAPQLLLWNYTEEKPHQRVHPIPFNRSSVDKDLKRFGMSITALEIRGIMNAITYLSGLPYIDADKIGMLGHSYGGYFTLHTMAADPRIKAGYSNACFNDRNRYPWLDWCYFGVGNLFHDAETAGLCAPRKLAVSVGKEDSIFDFSSAVEEAKRARRYFEGAGCPENFAFYPWDGEHMIPDGDEGFEFLFSALK